MKPGSVEPQPARDCFATLAMTTLDIPGRRRPCARMTRCHVWTAPFGQGEFGGVGRWSGAVMYPACWRGRLSAGPDGLRGSGSEHCGALLRRDDEAECRDPGPDHFAVAAWCSLRVSGRMARRGDGVELRSSVSIGIRDVTFPGRQEMFLGSIEHRFFVPTCAMSRAPRA